MGNYGDCFDRDDDVQRQDAERSMREDEQADRERHQEDDCLMNSECPCDDCQKENVKMD